jgi:hypothetical protein
MIGGVQSTRHQSETYRGVLLIAALGASLAVTASEAVPKFDVEASCRAAARANEAIDLAVSESTKSRIRDEKDARSELIQK